MEAQVHGRQGQTGSRRGRGGEVEASPTPGRAAHAGAPEIQPTCSWEGERGHRHVCMCGCAHVCQRMGVCVGTCVHMWTGTPVCWMLVRTQMKRAHESLPVSTQYVCVTAHVWICVHAYMCEHSVWPVHANVGRCARMVLAGVRTCMCVHRGHMDASVKAWSCTWLCVCIFLDACEFV